MTVWSALKASDDEQATVLVSFGVDDHDGHLVQLDYRGHLWPKAEDRTRTAAAPSDGDHGLSCGLCADCVRFLSLNQR